MRDMKLEFLYTPTSDLRASLALYRDGLGFTEVWREGDATVALALPDTEVQLMLDANDPEAPVGPLFVVDSVATFHTARPETLAVVAEPSEIPGGFLATYQDRAGRSSTSWTSRRTRPLRRARRRWRAHRAG
jgi:catechol 2,3-dioxygenase-like lactoylglutathione lyase family enzyme